MPAIEIGRVCVKTHGREAGQRCIVVDIVDENFVLISGPKKLTGVRRRRTNVRHLEPTQEKIQIKTGASDDDLLKIMGNGKSKEEPEPKPARKAKAKT
jgi:large subunit ribosomal protein L14e